MNMLDWHNRTQYKFITDTFPFTELEKFVAPFPHVQLVPLEVIFDMMRSTAASELRALRLEHDDNPYSLPNEKKMKKLYAAEIRLGDSFRCITGIHQDPSSFIATFKSQFQKVQADEYFSEFPWHIGIGFISVNNGSIIHLWGTHLIRHAFDELETLLSAD
jgi:hypothetical protein